MVLEFYNWLFHYLNKLHKEEIKTAKKCENEYYTEMFRLWREHNVEHK